MNEENYLQNLEMTLKDFAMELKGLISYDEAMALSGSAKKNKEENVKVQQLSTSLCYYQRAHGHNQQSCQNYEKPV